MASSTDVRDHPSMNCPDRLDVFIKELADTKAKFPDGQNAHIIREELHHIIQGLLMDLSSKYRLFQNALVHQGGSMVEGTKIGQADEFDYVFVLPALQQQLLWKDCKPFFAEDYDINIQSTKLVLTMKELLFMDDILFPDWCDQEENERWRRDLMIFKDQKNPFRDEIAGMVSEAIHRSLKSLVDNFPKWKYVSRLKYPSGRTYLQILKFTDTGGSETFVSVDICLAVQIPYRSTDSETLQLLFDFWSINVISCSRRSESLWEISTFSSLPLHSNEVRCYRVLKYLIQTFLESYFDMYTMEYKAVIGTYTLKTLILKAITESENKWELHHLGQRVLEILDLIRQDLVTVRNEESSSQPLKWHPLKVSMDYSLHPVSAEPALFPRSTLYDSRKASKETIFQHPEAIENQVSTLIELLLEVRGTDQGREHMLSQIEAIESLKVSLKNGAHQMPVMETLKDRKKSDKSGVYNKFLSIWHVIDREDFKAFMRMSKFSIPVQPEGKDDDCVVLPKTFRVSTFLNCCLFKKETYEDDSVELMEMDVFDHGDWQQVVCWNVNESVNLRSVLPVELCSFCASHN